MALVSAAVAAIVLVAGGGSPSKPDAAQPAVNWSFHGTKVYGKLGPEGVPLELGSPLGAANAHLTGAVIDGVACSSTEQLVYHHHAHLAIFVNGQLRPVPLGVGMVPPALVTQTPQGPFAEGSNTCLYWLHVHAQDGIIHIESPEVHTFLLGQFFDIWGQPLSPDQLGPYKGHVTATLNGKPWTGDPTQIPLEQRAQIVLNLGTPAANPPPIDWAGTSL